MNRGNATNNGRTPDFKEALVRFLRLVVLFILAVVIVNGAKYLLGML